ncbi:hypothetical protein RJ639_035054 [Escallonia herrerae]|uniref:Uncharacterized protein n=1 Tax=Escallonia herrerae TaxID=1293975 RepID=A0AA88WPE9_9ASTE|nr:hypothetical protein RJ639_035054 [Escallonia herrerae]
MERTKHTPAFRLMNAAITGNLKRLKNAANELDDGEGLVKVYSNVQDWEGHKALHYAAVGGYIHICKYLVGELKVDVNMKDGKGDTALHHATLGRKLPTAAYLIDNGANPNSANDKGCTALHYAADIGHRELLQLLISRGAEIDADSESGTPLHSAVAHGRQEAIKVLLNSKANAGADPNTGSCGITPLGEAASKGENEVIKCLLRAGANANVADVYGSTPLETAALNGNDEGVAILFPVTSPIPTIPDWSPDGVLKHVFSVEAIQQRELKMKENSSLWKSKGDEAFRRKDYLNAIYWYGQLSKANPSDATAVSNSSLCWSLLKEGHNALSDAEACIRLRPHWAKAHYRAGVAWKLLKNHVQATKAFSDANKLDPENEEILSALRESVGSEFGVPTGKNMKDGWMAQQRKNSALIAVWVTLGVLTTNEESDLSFLLTGNNTEGTSSDRSFSTGAQPKSILQIGQHSSSSSESFLCMHFLQTG